MQSLYRTRSRLVGLGLVALLACASPLAVQAQVPDQDGTVAGRVTDDRGAPVANVDVIALREGRRVARAVTNADGRYVLSIPAGEVSISVDGGIAWRSAVTDPVTVAAGGSVVVNVAVEWAVLQGDRVVVDIDGGARGLRSVTGMAGVVPAEEIRRHVGVNAVDVAASRPGVDMVSTGLSSRVVTFRGFNNIFSGALRMLVDYRKASIPSLRANFTHFLPTAPSDMARMEMILGPSSAIYGPNSANGVLNVLTRSPLDPPETSVSLSGGTQSVLQSEVRTSQRLGDRLGVKLSARWLQGQEFPYADPVEEATRDVIETDPGTFRDRLRDIGVPESQIPIREARVGVRDLDIERWNADVRADWTPSRGDTLVFQAGRTSSTGIEVTPLGAAQAGGWRYDYLQGRLHSGALFAQAFMNRSGAGETYLLRDGATLIDDSRLLGLQLRHTFTIAGDREEITWGGDWARTTPETGGTIHGQFEADDEITEYGAYVQSRTRIASPLQLIATLRWDESNVIEDPVLSPRVGFVLEPAEGHSFSASWARGFSTPTPTNYFLDLSAGTAPEQLGPLGYRVRARGTGREGIRFSDGQGGFQGMRSPFNPAAFGGPSQLLPATSTAMWPFAVGLLRDQDIIDDATASYLLTLDPGSAVGLNALDPVRGTLTPLAPGAVEDVVPVSETTATTMEVGYRGLIGEVLSVQTALWRTRRENFTSPLLLRTPLLTLDGPQLAGFLAANGIPVPQAEAIAAGLAPVPFGVISSQDITGQGAELVATYENYGSLTYWGVDVGAQAALTRSLMLSGSASLVSDDVFDVEGREVPLNAPELKGTLALTAANSAVPLSGEVRLRYHSGFPVVSGDYVGTACLGDTGPLVEDCVDSAALVDLTLGYQGLLTRDVALTVSVTNVLDDDYRAFVGVPTTGRQLITRLEYRLR